METDGSLACPQEHSIGPYPEQVILLRIPPHPISLRSILILSSTYVQVFLMVSILLAFPPKSYMHSSSPHACYRPANVIPLDLIEENNFIFLYGAPAHIGPWPPLIDNW
jgi:hypothetical protein